MKVDQPLADPAIIPRIMVFWPVVDQLPKRDVAR